MAFCDAYVYLRPTNWTSQSSVTHVAGSFFLKWVAQNNFRTQNVWSKFTVAIIYDSYMTHIWLIYVIYLLNYPVV